jgi:hypothetical protein
MAFFDLQGNSLGTFFAPVASGGLSFIGVSFNGNEQVGRVRITSGNAILGPNDAPPGTDVVAMDDFIYGEPANANVPEPSTWALLATGLLLMLLVRFRG